MYNRVAAVTVCSSRLAGSWRPAKQHQMRYIAAAAHEAGHGKRRIAEQFTECDAHIIGSPDQHVLLPDVLQLSERVWKTRLHVVGEYAREEAVYEITMVQRLGGRYGEHAAASSITSL
jgi:hypothetical protein